MDELLAVSPNAYSSARKECHRREEGEKEWTITMPHPARQVPRVLPPRSIRLVIRPPEKMKHERWGIDDRVDSHVNHDAEDHRSQ